MDLVLRLGHHLPNDAPHKRRPDDDSPLVCKQQRHNLVLQPRRRPSRPRRALPRNKQSQRLRLHRHGPRHCLRSHLRAVRQRHLARVLRARLRRRRVTVQGYLYAESAGSAGGQSV